MYKLRIEPRANRTLKRIAINYQEEILEALADLEEDPYMGKRLKDELLGSFSYRVRMHRIIYKINEKDKIVKILSAGHRSIVYQ